MKIKMVSGEEYDTVADFSSDRAVINMDGSDIFIVVDRDKNTGLWDQSGTPTSSDENKTIEALERGAGTLDNTVVDVVKDS